MVRARSEKLLVGETPKRDLSEEKTYGLGNEIAEIEYEGTVAREQYAIKLAFVDYYKNLFTYKKSDPNFHRDFLPEVPHLDSEQTISLERELNVKEVERVIEDLNNGKLPGRDGLAVAF